MTMQDQADHAEAVRTAHDALVDAIEAWYGSLPVVSGLARCHYHLALSVVTQAQIHFLMAKLHQGGFQQRLEDEEQ